MLRAPPQLPLCAFVTAPVGYRPGLIPIPCGSGRTDDIGKAVPVFAFAEGLGDNVVDGVAWAGTEHADTCRGHIADVHERREVHSVAGDDVGP